MIDSSNAWHEQLRDFPLTTDFISTCSDNGSLFIVAHCDRLQALWPNQDSSGEDNSFECLPLILIYNFSLGNQNYQLPLRLLFGRYLGLAAVQTERSGLQSPPSTFKLWLG